MSIPSEEQNRVGAQLTVYIGANYSVEMIQHGMYDAG